MEDIAKDNDLDATPSPLPAPLRHPHKLLPGDLPDASETNPPLIGNDDKDGKNNNDLSTLENPEETNNSCSDSFVKMPTIKDQLSPQST